MEYHIKTLEQFRPILVGLRKQAGLSQMAVASLLGVSQQSYAKFEANPSSTSVERLFKILGLLGGDMILSERMPSANRRPSMHLERRDGEDTHPISAPGPAEPRVSSSAPHSLKKNARKTQPAPAKLVPPSKKTENW